MRSHHAKGFLDTQVKGMAHVKDRMATREGGVNRSR
jgi:hypothetical protein